MNRTVKILTAVLVALALFASAACRMTTITGIDSVSSQQTAATQPVPTTLPYAETTVPPIETTAPVPETTTDVPTTAAQLSAQEVLDLFANALNLTRGYQGTISVHHTETFSGEVVEAEPLGALATRLANRIIEMVSDPHDATLTFTNGVGVNEDNETVPILLPKNGAFSLPAEGVRNAFMDTANGMHHVVINLVSESVGLNEAPYYNAGAIGYLDTSSLNLSFIKINSCTITYTGSVIDAYIRDDGYIDSVTYTINLNVGGSVTGLGITGSGTMEGVEYETWDLQW